MKSLQDQIESMGGRDPATADGYIVCTDQSPKKRIMATAVLHQPHAKRLSRFTRTFSVAVGCRPDDVVFAVSEYQPRSRCLITFETPEDDFLVLFASFLEYLKQSRLLVNPIISCKFDRKH